MFVFFNPAPVLPDQGRHVPPGAGGKGIAEKLKCPKNLYFW